jgi:hypothetical protein
MDLWFTTNIKKKCILCTSSIFLGITIWIFLAMHIWTRITIPISIEYKNISNDISAEYPMATNVTFECLKSTIFTTSFDAMKISIDCSTFKNIFPINTQISINPDKVLHVPSNIKVIYLYPITIDIKGNMLDERKKDIT